MGGTTLCDGGCVDTDFDLFHCGDCGVACGEDEVCSAGQCGLTCVGGTTLCDGGCVDTDFDLFHCGDCGVACGEDEVCSAGQCGLTCVGGTTLCDGGCVDTDYDPSNCGICGNACPPQNACVLGECKMLEPSCGGRFTTDWCPQVGTNQQYTKCEQVLNGGNTCVNPLIKYGTVEGGVPRFHGGNQYAVWCQQLGFSNYATGSAQYGSRDVAAPKGVLFGCTEYDESVWKWCDWQDGYWRNQSLDYHVTSTDDITSITCVP